MTIVTAGPGDLLYRFGPFLADSTLGRLYCSGAEVPLTPKSFKVLMVLVEMPGQCVDKEALFQQVWPDTFVEQNNLARNISMVRKALHERDGDQEYIVTIPGRGYRFVAPVDRITRGELNPHRSNALKGAATLVRTSNPATGPVQVLAPDPWPAGISASRAWMPSRWRLPLAVAATAAIAALLGAMSWLPVLWPQPSAEQPPGRKLWQLTSTGRLEGEPTWSPDGRRVAYSSDRQGNFDIWVQHVGEGSPIQITSAAARDWQPSWSPDGRYLAFRSERDGGGLFVTPADGGDQRRISSFGYEPRWSPESQSILFWDSTDAYTVGLDGAAPSKIASEVLSGSVGRFRIAWHPDGHRVSVYGNDPEHGAGFWTVPVKGGARVRSRVNTAVSRRIEEAGLRLGNFVWSPSGDMLYFEGRSEQTENVWRIKVDPQTLDWVAGPERLTTGSSLESGLALSPDGKRLAFGSRVESTIAWSLPFDAAAGRITGAGEPITPDGANAEILDMSPDGRQLVYRVNGHNRHELWIRTLDRGADRLRAVEADAAIVQPRWSRDGTQLAYLRRPSNPMRDAAIVLLGANDRSGERVLRASSAPEMVYDWSADGRSLLVRCRVNSTRWAICRLPNTTASGPSPETHVVAADARQNLYAAKNSPDERWVSFIARPDMTRSTVFVSPANGGSWIGMTDGRYFEDKPRWSPDGGTLYFLSNRTGFWNLWGRRFDSNAGAPVGDAFQVSHFDTSAQMIRNLADLQIAITRERLILPITQASGVIWVLENVDQ
jgi:Tol biopolymer transport system component/DNA-binding winged helix-turn-helix (wHTH) protein